MNPIAEWKEKALKRGEAYTSLDAMKLFAIVNMTADHIGHYFFPDELWWRAIGRITFPVWFFLVGYSRSRELGSLLWTYALLLVADRPFFNYTLLPLNALISIIVCRLFLNFCTDHKLLPNKLPGIIGACVILTPITTPCFEYGSMAILYAIFGRMIALKETKFFIPLFCVSYVLFFFWQFVWFLFDWPQGIYVAIGTFGVVWWLATFKNSVIWPSWKESRVKTFIAILSRNTLPYYFFHRLIFEVLAAFVVGHGLHFVIKL